MYGIQGLAITMTFSTDPICESIGSIGVDILFYVVMILPKQPPNILLINCGIYLQEKPIESFGVVYLAFDLGVGCALVHNLGPDLI